MVFPPTPRSTHDSRKSLQHTQRWSAMSPARLKRFDRSVVVGRGSDGIAALHRLWEKPTNLPLLSLRAAQRRGNPSECEQDCRGHHGSVLMNTSCLSLRRRFADCGNPRRTLDGSPRRCAPRDDRGSSFSRLTTRGLGVVPAPRDDKNRFIWLYRSKVRRWFQLSRWSDAQRTARRAVPTSGYPSA